MAKPLSEMSKAELTAELNEAYMDAAKATVEGSISFYTQCLVLIGMLQLKYGKL